MKPFIPLEEFQDRVVRIQKGMKEQGLDLLLAFGNEAEPQFVRYLSDYWPSFESAGVLIPAEGTPVLLIGPETLTFAKDRSKIPDIRRLLVFRESSDPEYPGSKLDTFKSVISELLDRAPKKVGIAGWAIIPQTIFSEFSKAVTEIGGEAPVKADQVMIAVRAIKSENELNCMREAYRITTIGFETVLDQLRPGMTELQARGIALAAMSEAGMESEAYPFWCLCGDGTNQAISRSRHKPLEKGQIIQLQVGARYNGYASSIGRPVVFGKATDEARALIEAGISGQAAILSTLKAGIPAKEVSNAYEAAIAKAGYSDWLLYGPCHATGLMEGEPPWIESNSTWILQENMTFCVDVFLGNKEKGIGLRFEDGVRVTGSGVEEFSNLRREVIEL
ncbi:Xaa-Pro aminopeptidase [Fontibacillus phaseoli]|uniref:Xaa-Pro aminopeptidase n=1 Tax=Fontibacillus phaseoli TaxID=1416533 RepID=A0A369BPK4_9BACL|nr:Xaa-Pro peptidase family protein [Fontibacillus phaseoli]RCX23550.1 Xaa-Pro aminopeptidase [Fontibacillus phaseoli]